MKRLIQLSFILIFALSSTFAFAQKKISNGKIQYEITELEGNSPELAMLKGTMISMFFMGEQQKMDIALMGGLMRVQTIMNAKEKEKSTVLMDMMGQKIQISDAGEEFSNQMTTGMMAQGGQPADYKITYNKKDKSTIAGYKCTKATLKTKEGQEIDMYVTDKINPANSQFQLMFGDLKGFPLQIMFNAQGIGVTLTAQEVKGDIDAANFAVPPGYQQMTMKEFSEQMGGMMNFGG